MIIKLYNCRAEFNRLDKTNYLSNATTITGTLRDGTSITEPIITIEYTTFFNFNYCYIEDFGRYYFINDVIIESNNIYTIVLSVDVLMTYKTGVLASRAFVTRTEHINYNTTFGGLCGRQVDNKRAIVEGYDIEDVEINNDVFLDDDLPYLPDDYTASFVLTGYRIYSGNEPPEEE